jgi:hypothetical protein
MGMPVDSIVIPRQCCPHCGTPRARSTAAKLLQFDRLCRSVLTGCFALIQAVKKLHIRSYHSSYPSLSAMNNPCVRDSVASCKEAGGE